MPIPILHPHPLSKPKDGFVSRHCNRWISYPISKLLLPTKITPNQISLANAVLAIPMIIAGIYGYLVIAALLWQLISMLDGIDGEIARAKGLSTKFGAFLDTLCDYIVDSCGVLAIGLALISRYNVHFSFVLSAVSVVITTRLISNFIVKSVPEACRKQLIPDNRDIRVLIVLLSAILVKFLGASIIFATLILISVLLSINGIYRVNLFYRSERISDSLIEQPVVDANLGLPNGF
ncbi:MAG: CDP-alcohol phosphatidyltransferase family protein [Desulfobacteraceae bacterium]|nr:CDP-alcohol phosphatidyltransferase family protein [Bacteroidota bacterium]MBL7174594.1 CDP-alcohol phosphatidyltransferase family protein [Desulfobacteraceae bacterium]